MTWTYSGDPSSSDKDAVRFLIGDVDIDSPLLQDEEINFLLSEYGSVVRAAYFAVLAIAAKCSQLVREETGRIKVWASDKQKQYLALAKEMKDNINNSVSSVPKVFAGGISHNDVNKRNADPDQVRIGVNTGIHDNNRLV